MTLKAVFFDFNGTIINDEAIHRELLQGVLVSENLRPDIEEFREICLGRRDRDCLREVLARRGRVADEATLDRLVAQKSAAYLHWLDTQTKLPIYPGVADLMYRLTADHVPIAIVTGAPRQEVDRVLRRTKLADRVRFIISGEDVAQGKPDPEGYQRAIATMAAATGDTALTAANCAAIEDTYPGLRAAKAAGLVAIGVANSHPFQMMQRQANWAVDFLHQLEVERLRFYFEGRERENSATIDVA
jgi:beta-phosphoglucomutase